MAKKKNDKPKNVQPIIVIKKKKKIIVGRHHGGAWKVAYADFVTAMMAFFLLMWLISVSDEVALQGIAQYFTPTESISDKAGLGFGGGSKNNITEGLNNNKDSAAAIVYGSPSKGSRADEARLPGNISKLENEHFLSIMTALEEDVNIKDFHDNLNFAITKEGFKIEIVDSENRPIFSPNSSKLRPYMHKIIEVIGKMISRQPNYILISGHTASVKEKDRPKEVDYWNLSTSRANEIRKYLMNNDIVGKNQVLKIQGNADKDPLDQHNPYNVKNIRISIILLNDSALTNNQRSTPLKSK